MSFIDKFAVFLGLASLVTVVLSVCL